MKLKFFCPRWGFEDIPWETFLKDVREAGYAGIEWFPSGANTDHQKVINLLQQHRLEFCIVMTVTGINDHFEDYLSALTKQLLQMSSIKPLFITAQTGREYFNDQQVEQCLECCNKVSLQTRVPIYQETHRNKWAYAAHVVHPFLEKHPDLLLTLDVSHWFCVSESYLQDQQPAVESAIRHARHIHARVGYTQGPQVLDPSAPEYADALEAHLKIWDQWIQTRINDGAAECTITPEFGPPPYMVLTQRNHSTSEEQWKLNSWMKSLLEKRYYPLIK
jgi:hypothetical protein